MTQGNGHGKAPSVLCILPITISMIVSVLVCAFPSVCSLHLLSLLLQSVKSKDLDKAKRCAVPCLWHTHLCSVLLWVCTTDCSQTVIPDSILQMEQQQEWQWGQEKWSSLILWSTFQEKLLQHKPCTISFWLLVITEHYKDILERKFRKDFEIFQRGKG